MAQQGQIVELHILHGWALGVLRTATSGVVGELVMKVENCQVSVVLYKVMGGGVCDFSFSEHWGPILKCPLTVGSKMMYLGCDKDWWKWRSACMSYVVPRDAVREQ